MLTVSEVELSTPGDCAKTAAAREGRTSKDVKESKTEGKPEEKHEVISCQKLQRN